MQMLRKISRSDAPSKILRQPLHRADRTCPVIDRVNASLIENGRAVMMAPVFDPDLTQPACTNRTNRINDRSEEPDESPGISAANPSVAWTKSLSVWNIAYTVAAIGGTAKP